MTDYLWIAAVVFTGILVVIGFWRLILRLIAKVSPELWLKINQINEPVKYDEAMQKRIAERKARKNVNENEPPKYPML